MFESNIFTNNLLQIKFIMSFSFTLSHKTQVDE